MRYLIQLLIPALILIGLVYVVLRSRQARTDADESNADKEADKDGDKGTFIFILMVGAVVAMGVVFALQGFWDSGP